MLIAIHKDSLLTELISPCKWSLSPDKSLSNNWLFTHVILPIFRELILDFENSFLFC